jgi:hypothetical protein
VIKSFLPTSLCLAAFWAVAGCSGGKPEEQLVGRWKFQDIDLGPGLKNPDDVAKAKQPFANAGVEFTSEKAFTMMIGGKSAVVGTWTLAGRAITITPSLLGDRTVTDIKAESQELVVQNPSRSAALTQMLQPIKAILSPDGDSVIVMASAGKSGSLKFSKDGG